MFRIKESAIVKAGIAYLNAIGHFAYKTPNYPIWDEKIKMFRRLNNIKGIPDIHVWLQQGGCAAIETKAKDGRQSEEQKNVQAQIEKRGGKYYLLNSIDAIMKAFPSRGIEGSLRL